MSARPKAFDMRLPGESFCADCPDHEACATGAPCWEVRRIAVSASEPRSTPGPSTGTPEPSQAAGEAQADAWDKGYASGFSNAMRRMSDEPQAPTTSNPFRAALASVDAPAPDVEPECHVEIGGQRMTEAQFNAARFPLLKGVASITEGERLREVWGRSDWDGSDDSMRAPAPDEADDDTLRIDVARAIWESSRADEGTISATGANHVAGAVLAVLREKGALR